MPNDEPSVEIRTAACEWLTVMLLGLTVPREALDRLAIGLSDPQKRPPVMPQADPETAEQVRRQILLLIEWVEALRPPS